MPHDRDVPPTKATMLPRARMSVAVTMSVSTSALTIPSSRPTDAASGT